MTTPLFRIGLALTLLAAFVAAFERSSAARNGGLSVSRCEIEAPHEAVALEDCLALAPDNVELMLDLAAMYESGGDASKAEGLYRRALQVDPQDAEAHLQLGRLLRSRGDLELARVEGNRVLSMRPNSSEAMALVGP